MKTKPVYYHLGKFPPKDLLRPLREGKGRRAGIFIFRELINVAEGKDMF